MSRHQFKTPSRPNEPQDLRPGFRMTKLVRQERRQFKIEGLERGDWQGGERQLRSLLVAAGMLRIVLSPGQAEWHVPGCELRFHAMYKDASERIDAGWVLSSKEAASTHWIECDEWCVGVALGKYRLDGGEYRVPATAA